MNCVVCKNKTDDHSVCRSLSKFICMCGCGRKFNLNELYAVGRNPGDRIKCRSHKSVCQKCNRTSTIIFPTLVNSPKELCCGRCIIKMLNDVIKNYDSLIYELEEIQKKIRKGNIIRDYYSDRYGKEYQPLFIKEEYAESAEHYIKYYVLNLPIS